MWLVWMAQAAAEEAAADIFVLCSTGLATRGDKLRVLGWG